MSDQDLTWDKKGVALNPLSLVHYMDHLAVVAIMMDIPYLFIDEETYLMAKRYYPNLNACLREYQEFSPEYLIENYDVSFMSDLWDRNTMRQKFQLLEKQYQKSWRNVHCPHGFSDKGFYLAKAAMEDIVLLYGKNMIDQLHTYGCWENVHQYIICGNYRYTYYLQNAEFYNSIFEEEIQSHFEKKQPLILYAPTWVDSEQSSSFFEACSQILDALPSEYNIIIKLHPRLELDDVVNYHRIIGEYENKTNVFFLTNYPLIFPILARTDIYIGDMSSIGYDFLIFDKPLFLLNKQNRDPETDRGLLLFKCGTEIKPHQYSDLFNIIEKSLPDDAKNFSYLRKKMWDYTFGKQRPFSDIRADVIRACESST